MIARLQLCSLPEGVGVERHIFQAQLTCDRVMLAPSMTSGKPCGTRPAAEVKRAGFARHLYRCHVHVRLMDEPVPPECQHRYCKNAASSVKHVRENTMNGRSSRAVALCAAHALVHGTLTVDVVSGVVF